MTPALLVLLIATLFFVIVPGFGAFSVRHSWRRFRHDVTAASLLPPLKRSRGTAADRASDRSGGHRYHFLGTLEGIQGDRHIWVHGDDVTVVVDMEKSDVFILPYEADEQSMVPLVRTSWRRAGTLIEGTKVLVAGTVDASETHPVMHASDDERVLVIFYEGPEKTLVRRSIWSGRQLNEYWNPLTPAALAGGSLALIIVAYVLLRQPAGRALAILSLALAALPVLPLLPPGVAPFVLYRWCWRRGRLLRAHRDIVLLPVRYLPGGDARGNTPDGEEYCRRPVGELEAGRYMADGVVLIDAPVPHADGSFEVYGHPGAGGIEEPASPLAERIVVTGVPETVSYACQRAARRYEAAALVVFAGGVAVNFVLALVLLRYLLR